MICEECKICWNYMVCENGCHGSTEPCDKFINEGQAYGIINNKQEYRDKVVDASVNMAKTIKNTLEPFVETTKQTMKNIDKIMKSSTTPDSSRQRFKTVACKGRNKKGWR